MTITSFYNNLSQNIKNLFSLGDKKHKNIEKIIYIALFAIALITIYFNINFYVRSFSIVSSLSLLFCASKTNVHSHVDKKNMNYFDFLRTKEQENALDTITSRVALNSYYKIFNAQSELYKAQDIVKYYEANNKIHGVHLLRHLAYVFSTKENRAHIKTILNYSGGLYIVKSRYFSEMGAYLKMFLNDQEIFRHLDGFVNDLFSKSKTTIATKQALKKEITILLNSDKNHICIDLYKLLLKYFDK